MMIDLSEVNQVIRDIDDILRTDFMISSKTCHTIKRAQSILFEVRESMKLPDDYMSQLMNRFLRKE